MSTIVTRAGKGSPLTNAEMDANFNNLNNDKAEKTGETFTGPVIIPDGGVGTQAVNGNTVATSISTATTSLPASANSLINGRMWNAPDGVTGWTNPVAGTYVLGLWYVNRVGSFAVNLNQVTTGPASCPMALRLTCTTAVASPAASDVLTIEEILEGYDTTQYIGKTFTVRGSIFSDVAGVVPVYIRGADRSYVFPVPVGAGVHTAFEHTVVGGLDPTGTWGTGTAAGARFGVSAMAGSGKHAPISSGWNAGTYFGLAGQVNAVGAVNRKLEFTEVSWVLGTAKPQAEGITEDATRMSRYVRKLYAVWAGYSTPGSGNYYTMRHHGMRAAPSITLDLAASVGAAGAPFISTPNPDFTTVQSSGSGNGSFYSEIRGVFSARY